MFNAASPLPIPSAKNDKHLLKLGQLFILGNYQTFILPVVYQFTVFSIFPCTQFGGSYLVSSSTSCEARSRPREKFREVPKQFWSSLDSINRIPVYTYTQYIVVLQWLGATRSRMLKLFCRVLCCSTGNGQQAKGQEDPGYPSDTCQVDRL